MSESTTEVLLLILLPVSNTRLFTTLVCSPYSLHVGYLSEPSLRCIWKPLPKQICYRESTQGIPLISDRFDPLEQLDKFNISS